jgi:hypothetical protein
MLRVYGVPISPEDARGLIATLIAEGSPGAITAAEMLTKGVERDLYAIREKGRIIDGLEGQGLS